MTFEQLNTALYEKLYAEQQEFISSLKTMTPEKIIQFAYELVIREDILLSLEENDLGVFATQLNGNICFWSKFLKGSGYGDYFLNKRNIQVVGKGKTA